MGVPSEQEIRRDYYQLNLRITKIADKHGCNRVTIWRKMNEYDIEKLPRLKVEWKKNRKYYGSEESFVGEHQLVAISDGADPHDIFGESHVHHINGCINDNRPENLITLTPEEHGLVENTNFQIDKEESIIYKSTELTHKG